MTEKTDLEQIENTLKNKGFIVEVKEDSFLVGLGRKVNISEVEFALDFDETVTLTRQGDKVRVR